MAGQEEARAKSSGATLKLEESGPTLRQGQSYVSDVATTVALSDSAPAAVDPSPASFGEAGRERYELKKKLGEGGMGEVVLYKDGWIGRDVAKKIAHRQSGSHPGTSDRFLREVRIQGQLEHPGIVPVHDLGRDADGNVYFTMKRIKGLTLEEIVRSDDPEVIAQHSRRKLLGAMSQVCLTVAFAHSRGVVHRDLKPANVMLGDYGEVYVLDWGVAKIIGSDDDPAIEDPVEPAGGGRTEAGALLGTPGYMSPEQVRGETAVDARSDVYALGAILFELLAREPLHRARTLEGLFTSTLSGAPGSPAERAPDRDVPPELDAICRRATALDAADRFQSAREMHDAIERFLDGQRDIERRRELASAHTEQAKRALAEGSEQVAMRELGAALALEPTNSEALETMAQMLVQPSNELPPEADAELKAQMYRDRARATRRTMAALVAWYFGTPLMIWMGVRSWLMLGVLDILLMSLLAYQWWMSRTGNVQPKYMRWAIPVMFANIGSLSVFLGPFVIVPAVATAACAAAMIGLRANRQTRFYIAGLAVLSVFVPAALQATGVLPPSYAFEDGIIKVLPLATGLPATPTIIFLIVTTVLTLVTCAMLVGKATNALLEAEQRVFGQAWRLRQMLPAAAHPTSLPPPSGEPACPVRAR